MEIVEACWRVRCVDWVWGLGFSWGRFVGWGGLSGGYGLDSLSAVYVKVLTASNEMGQSHSRIIQRQDLVLSGRWAYIGQAETR